MSKMLMAAGLAMLPALWLVADETLADETDVSQHVANQGTTDEKATRGNSHDRHWLLPLPAVDPSDEIPTCKQVLRYDWADEISSHYQIETYLRRLAEAAPERSRLVQYGKSYEGRSLNYLVISSAENLARLDSIRRNNLLLADPQLDTEKVLALTESSPVIVWLAYAVHGNEISPSDAALLTAYHLLADQRESTRELLERVVVIIDPLQNPDGRDRFVNVYRETRGVFPQSFPRANEHTERWPGGRSNHYWFDMNRDWFLQSQQEVRAKVAAYLEWQPQMYVDAHEMGANSSFYFPPPTDPKNPYLMPSQYEWFQRLGKHQAGWFDRYGFGYMTREVFDAFYPGYGSEWPTLQGGLGILWEQASARGAVIDRDDETQLTYHDGVRHHYISGIATLEFAAAHRRELLEHFRRVKKSAVIEGGEGSVQHFFLSAERPQRSTRLASMLVRNGIEVKRLGKPLQVNVIGIQEETEQLRQIPAGSFHIPVAQPTSRLIRSLLERSVEMDEKFLRRQLERNELRLPDEIYDVTAWSMPLAYDVQAYAAGSVENVPSVAWSSDSPAEPEHLELPVAQVAYLLPGTDGALQAASKLLQQDVRVHVADEPFQLNGRLYDRGTLIVKVAENGADLRSKLQAACGGRSVEVIPTDTAYVDQGAHMGGPDVVWVKPPKILLVVNQPTNYSSGHTWYLLDQFLSYPTIRIKGSDLGRVKLSEFNTLVLPDGRYSTTSGFDKDLAERLKDWIRAGGTLITLRGASAWAADKEIGLLENEIIQRKVPVPDSIGDEEGESAKPEEVQPDSVPGAFFRANVFTRHWVTFGSRPQFDVFYSGRLILSPTTETQGRSLVTFGPREDLLTSGFCWPENLDLLAETPYVVSRELGEGHLISFTDDPNFRAMYPSLQRLFLNAVLFGPGH